MKGSSDNGWAPMISAVGSRDLVYQRLLTREGKAADICADGTLPEYCFVQLEPNPNPNSKPISVELIKIDGWYTDPACTQKYDFSLPVTGEIHLYGRYVDTGKTGTYVASTAVLTVN